MAFLSAYSGTTTVYIGDQERGYWVQLKDHINQGDREDSERALAKMSMVNGNSVLTPDVPLFRQRLLLASIAAWNLDDENGNVWPLTIRSIQQLPNVVFDQLWEIVDNGVKERSPEEMRQFRDAGVSGDPDGYPGTAITRDLPAGAGDVAATWSPA